ncbi:hypothetical protein D3C80_1407330 [compost metagenome]
MRARGHFAENDVVATHKQFNAKQAETAQGDDHFTGDLLCALKRQSAHFLRLPGFAVIAVFLTVSNRVAEMHAVNRAHCEQGDFKIKFHHALNDDASGTRTSTLLGIVPGFIQRAFITNKTLSFARRTHDRLNDARVTNLFNGLQEIGFAIGETVA